MAKSEVKELKIKGLDDRAIQMVLREMEPADMALALKSAGQDVKNKIFRNMSKRAAPMLQEDMENLGSVAKKEVELAREKVNSVIDKLIEAGEISKGGRATPKRAKKPRPIKIDVRDQMSLREGLVKMAMKARKEGLLSLEDEVGVIDDDFLKKGLQLVVDGTDPELVMGMLKTELIFYEEEEKMRIKEEALRMEKELSNNMKIKEMMVEGVLSLQSGDNPHIVDEKLGSFRPKRKMFMFEDIVIIDNRTLQMILRKIEPSDMALALKATPQDVKDKIFQNMSKRAAAKLQEDMERMGPVRMVDVKEAQVKIVSVIRRLEEAGEIIITRS